MMGKKILVVLLFAITGLILTACSPSGPEVIKKVVTEKVVETVIIEGTPQVVEKEVTKVVEVEKEVEKVVTATPLPETKTLIVGTDLSATTSIDPHSHFEPEPAYANSMSCQTLVKISADNWYEPGPLLAKSWEISDDGLIYTFHLNPEARFSSGNPVTANDVRFSWMRLKNLQGSPSWFMGWVEEIKVVDDLTVQVTLNEPSAAFLQVTAVAWMCVLDSKLVKEHGGSDEPDAATTDTATAWLDQNSAGSGPYILTQWSPRYEIVLEKNPNYWGTPAKVDKIILRQVDDQTTALQMLQRGDMDILLNADVDLYDRAEADTTLNTVLLESLNLRYISMTCDPELSEPLSDQRVRQAINFAIDRDSLIDGVLSGFGQKTPSVIPLGMPGVDPSNAQQRDLEKAKVLLKEAGYEDGFELTLVYPVYQNMELVATKLQSDLTDIGITLNIEPMDYSRLISGWYDNREPAMYIAEWIPDYIDYTIWTDYWGYGDHGFMWIARCENQDIEELTKTIAQDLDHEDRKAAVVEWQELMMDMAFSTTLYQPVQLLIMRDEVEGFGYIPTIITDWSKLGK
ncbi:MAG: ABC transporter substrate-binding protein [Anaerolineales bacterium]|nr:ABC transporter substrate-binding protein [Anaerolineales bacterium]